MQEHNRLGAQATVIGVHPNENTPPGVTSVGKYIVRFDEGDDAEFLRSNWSLEKGERALDWETLANC